MRNIKLVIEYDGTNYHGWQKQPKLKSIQGTIEEAIRHITGEKVSLTGSGRTDAGVHALAQVASFKTESEIKCRVLKRGLNAVLPSDISIKEVSDAENSFNARFSAKGKVYIYRILNRDFPSPFEKNYSWFVPNRLNMAKVRRAAGKFTGKHHFGAFRSAECSSKKPEKEIKSLKVRKNGDIITFEIEADGFLQHMVRIITGTLVDVGKGKIPAENIDKILSSLDRRRAGVSAPSSGLYLKEVFY